MKKSVLGFSLLLLVHSLWAQKKPLHHGVYDGWQSIASPLISNDGKWVVYQVNLQEGDGHLIISNAEGTSKKIVDRGYNAVITEDSRFVICKIKPYFKETREARIKKKKPEDMPKDSLAVLELGKESLQKFPRVKSFKTPAKGSEWVAWHLEKAMPEAPKSVVKPDSLSQINKMISMADSLLRVADSMRTKANEAKLRGLTVLETPKREATPKSPAENVDEGTTLVLKNLYTGAQKEFKLVSFYQFSDLGNVLLVKTTKKNGTAGSQPLLLWHETTGAKTDTVMRAFNDAKNFAFDEAATQLAFVAERDSASKALVKFYKLWYYKPGMDSAVVSASRETPGVKASYTISADYSNMFSKNGKRLFFGLSPVRPPKDTTLVDFETARLDVWNYKDEYLQPQQLVQLNQELRRSYLAVKHDMLGTVVQLGDEACETVELGNEGDANIALGKTNRPYRVQNQWDLANYQDLYLIDINTGERKRIAQKVRGGGNLSPKANYALWYDWKQRHYFTYDMAGAAVKNVTQAVKVPLYDEDDDHPDDPPPHGIMGWHENDAALYVYDKYDVWKIDPAAKIAPSSLTASQGRTKKLTLRNVVLDREERWVKAGQTLLMNAFDHNEKGYSWVTYKEGSAFTLPSEFRTNPVSLPSMVVKAKQAEQFAFNAQSPAWIQLFTTSLPEASDWKKARRISDINPQQSEFNWYTVELHRWKMFDGKMSEGLLFKPEDFDPNKKYPVIFYFYERNADNRYNYRAPAPSASTVNIAWFTSNGYLVFDPNIYYKNGEPGESAYNSVVSAAKYLSKMKFVDSTKMAIQGQSWGGYQVAYIITRTPIFAAAGAGAPVSNMFSAYGGIRWGTGISRQFQYEKSQSRLGFTPWQRPDLYTKNSPLFTANKVTTPLLMMHNDKDGAVPWYQGIEFFTALRRLDKKVWMLQYNDEDHNLVERRNRKDLSVRLDQFFAHYLKGAPMPKWMSEGVPATLKGIDWGFDLK